MKATAKHGGQPRAVRRYAVTIAIVAVCTGVSALLHEPLELGNQVAIYLLGVVLVAASLGRGPAVLASLLGALAVDFLFLPPVFGLMPAHAPHLLTLVVMLVVAAMVGTLAARLREELQRTQERERNTATLHGLARDIARATDANSVALAVDRHVRDRFHCRGVLLVADARGEVSALGDGDAALDAATLALARAAMGRSTPPHATTPMTSGRCQLLATPKGTVGVLVLVPIDDDAVAEPPPQHLEAFANQAATALERTLFAEAARNAAVAVEQERLRNALLSSVSHDLRTPIAAIIGASSALLRETSLDGPTRTELLEIIHQEGGRLEQHVRNLLDMTRLEAGTVAPRIEWTPVEEVIGAALTRLEEPLRSRDVAVHVEPALTPVPMDDMLIELVLVNLLENALRHTQPAAAIELCARAVGDRVQFDVADRGPGLAGETRARVLAKLRGDTRAGGAGLGLAICRAIVALHGGTIVAVDRPGGGAVFRFELPRDRPASLPPLMHSSHSVE